MTKKIKSLGEFVEEFQEYKTFYFSDEISKGIWAMRDLETVVISNELFDEFIEKATSSEIFLVKELLEKRLKTSKFRKMPVNFIDHFIEKLNQEMDLKYLISNEVVNNE